MQETIVSDQIVIEDRGNVEFGLWRGEHDVGLSIPTTLETEYDISKLF